MKVVFRGKWQEYYAWEPFFVKEIELGLAFIPGARNCAIFFIWQQFVHSIVQVADQFFLVSFTAQFVRLVLSQTNCQLATSPNGKQNGNGCSIVARVDSSSVRIMRKYLPVPLLVSLRSLDW